MCTTNNLELQRFVSYNVLSQVKDDPRSERSSFTWFNFRSSNMNYFIYIILNVLSVRPTQTLVQTLKNALHLLNISTLTLTFE